MSILKTNQLETLSGEVRDVANMGIESGSNENGSWVKFPDGTMIQWGIIEFQAMSVNELQEVNFSFPQPFIDTNYGIQYSIDIDHSGGAATDNAYIYMNSLFVNNKNTDNVHISTYSYTYAIGEGVWLNVMVIGRWK